MSGSRKRGLGTNYKVQSSKMPSPLPRTLQPIRNDGKRRGNVVQCPPPFDPIDTSPSIKQGFEKLSTLKPLGLEKSPTKVLLEEVVANPHHINALKYITELRGNVPMFVRLILDAVETVEGAKQLLGKSLELLSNPNILAHLQRQFQSESRSSTLTKPKKVFAYHSAEGEIVSFSRPAKVSFPNAYFLMLL